MDIIVTLPKGESWDKYQEELAAAATGDELNFKCNNLPSPAVVGNRCYIVYRGAIRGWLEIVRLDRNKTFECETTGRRWSGNFIVRSGDWHPLDPAPGMIGFQGFRYFDRNTMKVVQR